MYKEERFACDNNERIIDFEDKEPRYCLPQEEVCELLNKQSEQIHSLEEQLKNAIVPKFKIGDYLYSVRLFAGKILLAEGYVTSITKTKDGVVHYHLETKPNEFGCQEQYGVEEENCFLTMTDVHEKTSELLAELEGK